MMCVAVVVIVGVPKDVVNDPHSSLYRMGNGGTNTVEESVKTMVSHGPTTCHLHTSIVDGGLGLVAMA